ncbi:MAG: thiamine-phosphate kinase [Bacteroidales bacterium]|nr:thiamine-phosphate kinase [Bacteroidales bacterium]
MNFSDIGRVKAIEMLFEGTPFKPFKAASASMKKESVCVTRNKLLLEGTDFNLVYFPLKHLGYKAITIAAGQLYAAFAHPDAIDISIGVSAKLDFPQIKELWEGMVSAAKEHGFANMNLDLVPSRNGLIIALAASGHTEKIWQTRRPKPQSKDLICVSGSLGAAYLGMSLLEEETAKYEKDRTQPDLERYKMIVGSYLKPELSPSVLAHLEELEIVPSTSYLVDRGLADALKQLCRDTGLGAKVYADKIPFEGNTFELGKKLDIDPVSAAFGGGEDYRLLFTIPILKMEAFRHNFQTFDIIGHLAQSDVGAVLVMPEGAELPVHSQGWKEDEE